MQEIYSGHGVRFRYPDTWEVGEQHQDDQITITTSSPGTSFWSITIIPESPDPDELIEAALDAFREEYPEMDVYAAKAKLCDRPAAAKNVEFVCLELLNTAWLRSIRTPQFTILLLYQGTDAELEETESVLEQMTRSLECTEAGFADELTEGQMAADEWDDEQP